MKRSANTQRRRERAVEERRGLLHNVERVGELRLTVLRHPKETLVRVEEGVVRYDGRVVCEGLRFDIRRGDRVALTGPNGAGKSSALRALCGAGGALEGKVSLASGLVVSYVPQEAEGLCGGMRDFIQRNGLDETLFKAILRNMDMSREHFDQDLSELSQGQKKKLLLARSLCTPAHLYLWDEPLNYIDKFIFVSKFAQKKHIEFNPGYASKAVQLYNFTPDIPTRINKKINHRYLLYFGRLSNEKGINSLLEAIRDIPEIDLKIIGRGPLSKEIGNNYPKNVSFLGFKEGQELKEYVKNALFTIVPSEWYENNPLSIIESLSLGTPVIGSNIGGIPELIQDEKTGFTFTMGSPADLTKTIRKAIAIPEEKLYEMSIACNKFAQQHFSADKHFNYLISIYQSILKASK